MYRRRITVAALACALLAILPGVALAGGVVVTLDKMPADVRPGQPFDAGFTIISMHDGEPVVGQRPLVEAVNPQTKEVITAAARPEGEPGHYAVTLTLPVEGNWAWRIHPFTESENYPASELTPIQVAAATTVSVAAAAAAPPAGEPVGLQALPVAPLAGGLALLALVGLSVALRGRLRPARL